MTQNPKISVLGVGRDGCRFINEIIDGNVNFDDVSFAAFSLYEQDLTFCGASRKIYVENFADTDVIFIFTDCVDISIASVISKILQTNGMITVEVFVHLICGMHDFYRCDVFNNSDVFFDLYFHGWDFGYIQTISGFLISVIYKSGFENLDFADVKNFLAGFGFAAFSSGYFRGCNKVSNVVLQAVMNVRRDNLSKILVNITSDSDINLEEMTAAIEVIRSKVPNPDVEILWRHVLDDSLKNSARVSLIGSFKKGE